MTATRSIRGKRKTAGSPAPVLLAELHRVAVRLAAMVVAARQIGHTKTAKTCALVRRDVLLAIAKAEE